jgi:hypothetical protein
LRNEKQIDLSSWNLVDSSSEKRPNRIDHTLVWQAKQPLDSAMGRIERRSGDTCVQRLQVYRSRRRTDEASAPFIKIPE